MPEFTAGHRFLDVVVGQHRATIAVVFPVVGAVLLVGSAYEVVPPGLAYHPALILVGVAVMRLPVVATVAPFLDRRSVVALLVVAVYSYLIEFVGVTTGVPYGRFEYLAGFGPVVGGVPVALPVLFVPLVVNAVLLTHLLAVRIGWVGRVGAAVTVVVVVDLVLDPAAVAVGLWTFPGGGSYYGVPASNFVGWVLSAVVSVTVLEWGFDTARLRERVYGCRYALDDFVSFTVLWGLVNVVFGQWVPVALTVGLVGVLVWVNRFDVVGFESVGRWRRWNES